MLERVSSGRLFYGWIVVAAAFTTTFVGFGLAYTFSVFAGSLQAEFGASRGSVSTIFGVTAFVYFGAGLVTGPLADRFGVRRLAALGMVLVGAGAIGAGSSSTLHGVFAAYVLGVGAGIGCSYVPAVAAVQRWFSRRRGLASGLAVSGIGVGTLILPPLATVLIDLWGWRTTYVVLGGLLGALGLAAACFLRDEPASMGLQPDGDVAGVNQPMAGTGVPLRAALRSRRFAILYLATLLSGVGAFVPFVHLAPYAADHGVPATPAAMLVAIVGVGSTGARFLLGGLADKFGREASLAAMVLGMAATLALWPALSGFWALAAFALLFGAFYGGWVALLPSLVMDWFRRARSRRHHRHALHRCRHRHARWPVGRGVRFRPHPELWRGVPRLRFRRPCRGRLPRPRGPRRLEVARPIMPDGSVMIITSTFFPLI